MRCESYEQCFNCGYGAWSTGNVTDQMVHEHPMHSQYIWLSLNIVDSIEIMQEFKVCDNCKLICVLMTYELESKAIKLVITYHKYKKYSDKDIENAR